MKSMFDCGYTHNQMRELNKKLNPRQRKILDAILYYDGVTDLKSIAMLTGLSVNGISQTINSTLSDYILDLGGIGKYRMIAIKRFNS